MAERASAHRPLGVRYRVFGLLLRRPSLLRGLCALGRLWPTLLFRPFGATSHAGVASVLRRPAVFSNTAHAPNMIAGEFAIGMEDGPRHRLERQRISELLPTPSRCGLAAAAEARKRQGGFVARGGAFDLIDDYLVWVAWRAWSRVFGRPAESIALDADPQEPVDEARAKAFFLELRHLGVHLLIGPVAPAPIQGRAQSCAYALNGRIAREVLAIERMWQAAPQDRDSTRRNAVGIPWVAHPGTVQAAALLAQELLDRPRVHRALVRDAGKLGDQAWTDAAFRSGLKKHVLELLRFRPVFPVLVRDVLRDSLVETSPGRWAKTRAGASVKAWTIGALSDPRAFAEPQLYLPDRELADPQYHRLQFGMGPRACPASEHVLEVLASALIGLLQMPGLRHATDGGHRISYEGPIVIHMPLRFGS